MRIRVLILVALLATGLSASTAAGHTPSVTGWMHDGAHAPGLPDLYPDAADGAQLHPDYDFGQGPRLLLRFNGYIHNRADAGTAEIIGTGNTAGEMGTVRQRVYSGDGTTWADRPLPGARLLFESADRHNHWHLRNAAGYSLRDVASPGVVHAPSMKVGFCLTDTLGDAGAPASQWEWNGHGNCGESGPAAATAGMGMTPGWRDDYGRDIPYQWIDVSQTQPGSYLLRSEVDPDEIVDEAGGPNTPADTAVSVPGYAAQPVTRTGLPRSGPSTIQLASSTVATTAQDRRDGNTYQLGTREFRIVSGPADGTLELPAGTPPGGWFTGSTVTYTPSPGSDGSDTFTFAARDSRSGYPVSPDPAAVSLTLAAPAPAPAPAEQVVVSKAPATLVTGTTSKLEATVTDPTASPAVTWSAGGVAGGNATHGTVTRDGLYTAPATVPEGGRVTLRATSGSGASGTAQVQILAAEPHRPAPTLDPPPASDKAAVVRPSVLVAPSVIGPALPGQKPTLSKMKVVRAGRFVVVAFTTSRTGRARTTLLAGTRKLRSCTARVRAGTTYTCRLAVSGHPSVLKVSVALRRLDGRVVTWRSPRLAAAAPVHRH